MFNEVVTQIPYFFWYTDLKLRLFHYKKTKNRVKNLNQKVNEAVMIGTLFLKIRPHVFYLKEVLSI